MEQKRTRQFPKKILIIVLALIFVAAGIVVWQIGKADGHMDYLTPDGKYLLQLKENGTFLFYDTSDSMLTTAGKDNVYRWENDMLVLEFGASGDKLLFRQEGDALVLEDDLSVRTEGSFKVDGLVLYPEGRQ